MMRCADSTAGVILRSVRRPSSVISSSRARRSRLRGAALGKSFLHQAVDHPGDGGAVVGDQSCKRHLVEPRIGLDGRKRRVLHRREVEAGFPDLGQKHRHRDLLEAARQMPGHVVVVFHRILRWRQRKAADR